MIIFGRDIARRTVGMVVGGFVLVLVLSLLLWQCDKRRNEKAQSRVNQAQGQAAEESAADAINTVEQAGEREASSEDMTRQSDREIRAAEGAADRVNPAVNAAGWQALCRRQAYVNHPKCKALRHE